MIDSTQAKKRFIYGLYNFEATRGRYGLCSPRTGFFQPFRTASDVQQQLKTTLVSPVAGLIAPVRSLVSLVHNLLIMGAGILSLSPSLFVEGAVDSLVNIETAVVTPIVACAVTLASLVSLITRTLATLLSIEGGAFNNAFLSFLPDNPYVGFNFSFN